MRRYIRPPAPGATVFFTLTLQDRSATDLVDHIASLRHSVASVKARHPFHTDAIVVLPDHLHALWTLPESDGDYSTRWMLVKQTFTRMLRERGALQVAASTARGDKGERNLWQRRFWEHRIRDEEDLARHIDYIHFNPVKHGWVLCARDWPYSSLHRFAREGRLPPDWGISADVRGEFGE